LALSQEARDKYCGLDDEVIRKCNHAPLSPLEQDYSDAITEK
jgi:hypothetical protein